MRIEDEQPEYSIQPEFTAFMGWPSLNAAMLSAVICINRFLASIAVQATCGAVGLRLPAVALNRMRQIRRIRD